MRGTLQVTIDCSDPATLAAFWVAALGYVVEPPPGGFHSWNAFWRSTGVPADELPTSGDAADSIVDPDGTGPRIWFQRVPEVKTVKNRVHLDLMVSGGRAVPLPQRRDVVDAEVDRLTDLGATVFRVLGFEGQDYYAVVLQDPEGNEFCVA